MNEIIIYHNPKCSTSRNVLAMLHDKGIEPIVIEYLKAPLSHAELKKLMRVSGLSVREILRSKEAIYAELDLANKQWTDEQLIGFMVEHPILMNRPIVVTPKGVRLCRPKEVVLEILP